MSLKEELRPWIEEAVEAQDLKKRIMVLETGIRTVLSEYLPYVDEHEKKPNLRWIRRQVEQLEEKLKDLLIP